jgi:hypothetical protein
MWIDGQGWKSNGEVATHPWSGSTPQPYAWRYVQYL